jgi:WD40 repeat protein
LESHSDSVTSISWHPFEEAVLASASYDRKIAFWDLSRAGEEQTPEDAQDGPPELYANLAFFLLFVYSILISCAVSSSTAGIPTAFLTSVGI